VPPTDPRKGYPPTAGMEIPVLFGACTSLILFALCRQRIEPPSPRHALQFVISSVIECEISAHHIAPHRIAHKDLTRSSHIADSLRNGDGETGDVIPPHLNLTGVYARPQLEPEIVSTGQDLGGTAQRPSGGVEGNQETVPHCLHFVTPVADECRPDHGIMMVG